MSETKANKEYKDRLFRLLFGTEEYKENILSLYNALNNTNHTNPEDIEIVTLKDVIYIKMKNDVGLLLDSYLSLWEQQSTINPNMPVRGLMYFGESYDAYIKSGKYNIYGSKLIMLPTPKYIVLYNGGSDAKAVTRLRLSDAFIHKDENQEFEWTATMINLNKGKNDKLLEKCKPLSEYMYLVNAVREHSKDKTFEKAIDAAVYQCIENDVLKDFLVKHRAEVKDVCITEFNEIEYADNLRQEGHEEGLKEGVKKGVINTLASLITDGLLSLEKAAEKAGVTEEEFVILSRKYQS